MRSIFIVFILFCRIVIFGDTCDFCDYCDCCEKCCGENNENNNENNESEKKEKKKEEEEEKIKIEEEKKRIEEERIKIEEEKIKIEEEKERKRREEEQKRKEEEEEREREEKKKKSLSQEERNLKDKFYALLYDNFLGIQSLYQFYDKRKKSFFVVGCEGNPEKAKEEMKEETEKCIKKIFDNIELISKEDLDNYEKIKPLATFFLSNKDYDNYINECVEKENKNWQKTIAKGSKVNKILEENKSFKTSLTEYIRTKGFNEKPKKHQKEIDEISLNLSKCKPYEYLTYRGTRLYDNERKPLKINNHPGKDKFINDFIKKIKTGILEMESIASFSSDIGVAGHFAAFIENANEAFNFVICNHINKTGVNIYEDYDKNILGCGIPEEKEVLYPQGSKFKILGIHKKH